MVGTNFEEIYLAILITFHVDALVDGLCHVVDIRVTKRATQVNARPHANNPARCLENVDTLVNCHVTTNARRAHVSHRLKCHVHVDG